MCCFLFFNFFNNCPPLKTFLLFNFKIYFLTSIYCVYTIKLSNIFLLLTFSSFFFPSLVLFPLFLSFILFFLLLFFSHPIRPLNKNLILVFKKKKMPTNSSLFLFSSFHSLSFFLIFFFFGHSNLIFLIDLILKKNCFQK